MKSKWNLKNLRNLGGGIVVIILLAINFLAAFFLTTWLYKITGIHLSAWLAQLVNSLLGFFFFGLIMGAVSAFMIAKGRNRPSGIIDPIIQALERMAKGDFSVRLDNTFDRRENEIFGDLVKSVNQTAQELNQMESMRQEFISNVSHEIQSPLTSIRGFTQALQDDHLSHEERHHYLNIIEAESTRMSRVTDNLLKLAALEADHAKFEPTPYRLDKQIRDLILSCEPQWSAKTLDMDVALDEVTLTADEDLLSQVWINLIHNSIKFTPPNGRVCVELHQAGQSLQFQISDTGPGISVEDQAHVFERFFKADRSRQSAAGGSGLGLSIAKKIVEMHGGCIGVQSQSGAGSIFLVTLPIK